MRKSILVFMLLCFSIVSLAQSIRVTGRITGAAGQPVQNASVVVRGTNNGVTTDRNGEFAINAARGQTLVISSVGFSAQELVVERETVNISLSANVTELTDVVVVGYGTQRRGSITGSVTTVSGEELTRRQVASTSNLLQGLAPGLVVQQTSGRPGADQATLRIRGIGSFSAVQSPLILVDNIEMSLDAIDPNSIESITVLKDAASTAIFGNRGGNGVILVTTKRGKKGTQIAYNGFTSFQSATNLPEKLTSVEHMELYNEMLVNSGKAKVFSDATIQAYKDNPADNFRYFNTDWLKEIFTNSGFMQNHNMTLSSGSDNVNFFASGGYLTQQGLTPNTSFKRFDLRMNVDVKVSDKLTIRGDFIHNRSTTVEPGGTSAEFIIRQALGVPAIGAGKFGNGMYGDAGQSNNRNPIGQVEASGTEERSTPSLILKGTILYRPVKGLELEGFVTSNTFVTNAKTFLKTYDVYRPDLVNNTLNKVAIYPNFNSISESYNNGSRTNYLAQATYSKSFGDHNFKLLTGFQAEDFRVRGLAASRDSVLLNQPYINNGISVSRRNAGGASENTLAGFYGRFNYNYKERYLIELNGRYDGSSRFSQERDKQWGKFGSVSAGWVISQEKFFGRLSNTINYMKLRASYGGLGNQNLGSTYYPYSAVFSPGINYYFGGVTTSGYAQLTASNPEVSWETSRQANIGMDLSFLKNKITVTADVFDRSIGDMLLALPVPVWLGQNAPQVNVGGMTNRGWELGITHRNKLGAFRYDVTANVSDVVNKVEDLGGQEVVSGLLISRPGSPINSYYGYIAEGLFQTDAEVAAAPVHSPQTKAGDIRYKDVSGAAGKPDGKIDQFDRVILGNRFPRYEYSLNANAGWKGFDLNVFFQGVGKRQTYISGTGAWAFTSGDFIATAYQVHKDRWTPSNPNASYPRLTDGVGINFANSSYWMKSGAYLRLKNLALGYTLPASFIQRLKIQQVRFYVSGSNLLTWDKYQEGFDPEVNEQNGEFYPIMKTYTVGANIRF